MRYFSNPLKTEFGKNVLTLMTGTTIAQAIPIAITPILTRIYSPDDFGVFALFLAIIAIAGAVANGQYEQAIMLPKKDEDALNLVALGVFIAAVFSLFLLLIVFFFNNHIIRLLGNEKIGDWLYLIPAATLLVGIYNSLNFFNIRKKKYKNVSASQISRSSSLGISQIVLGFATLGSFGLILGQIFSYFTGNLVLYKTFKKSNKKNTITKERMKIEAITYKKFPLYSLPSIFINSINLNAINFLISAMFSVTTLGFYLLTQRVIGLPARVISSSIGQVYFQEASQSFLKKGTTEQIFIKTLKKLTFLSFPIFVITYLLAEPVFEFVFGAEWRISGTYAKILIPLAAIRFVSGTLSSTFSIHQKQQYLLIFNLVLLFAIISIFIFCNYYKLDIKTTLLYYSLILSIIYLLLLLASWNVSKYKA